MNELIPMLTDAIKSHPNSIHNMPRKRMIELSVANGEACISKNGTLATWTPPESTGRSPQDTVTVRRQENLETLDWASKYNIPFREETFDMFFEDALKFMRQKKELYIVDRVIGADPTYALPVKLVTDRALGTLFADNMFRPVTSDIEKSCFYQKPFHLICLPYDKLNTDRYHGRLRKLPDGRTSNMVVAMDMERRMGIVIGSSYCGTMKKMLFTVINYYLPFHGILPLHCSANEGKNGESAMLLGLSGTGKTTLSADHHRALLGDDEHGWGPEGIANFEYGCYAKMLDITEDKEPDIWNAVLHEDDYLNHGAIIENALMFPNGEFDFSDDRLTPNSRSSYPLSFLENIKEPSVANHPKTIIFLTADAYGVLPPISKLDPYQARLWFLMGYTSKLAGTETGIIKPETTFSRFFGAPFMPGNPDIYSKMLGEKMDTYNTRVFLINTGWSGGEYGVGNRINLKHTRAMLNAALEGKLDNVEYDYDPLFHLNIPKSCPNIPQHILFPKNTWEDKGSFDLTAKKLANQFSKYFDKSFKGHNIHKKVKAACPGKK